MPRLFSFFILTAFKIFFDGETSFSLGEKIPDLRFACFRKTILFNRALIISPKQITLAGNHQGIRSLSEDERLLLHLSLMQSFFPPFQALRLPTVFPFSLKQADSLRHSSRLCNKAFSRPTWWKIRLFMSSWCPFLLDCGSCLVVSSFLALLWCL